jgi:hypothetical protein
MDKLFTTLNPGWGQDILFLNDIYLGIPFLIVVHFVLKNYIKKSNSSIHKKYLMTAWYLRVLGAVMSALMYQYYYHGGDTMMYFKSALILQKYTFSQPGAVWTTLFGGNTEETLQTIYRLFGGYSTFLTEEGSKTIVTVAYFLSFIAIKTYIIISFIISMFALYGCWHIFKVFYELYPHLEKQLAIACLFVPSVFFWGTGVMKDPLCLGALGILHYAVYNIFHKRKNIVKNAILTVLSVYLIKTVKVYIILAFAPAIAVWLFARYSENIKNKFFKAAAFPLLVAVGGGLGVLILSQMAAVANRYSFETVMETAKNTQNWLVYSTQQQGGSFYTLGDLEYSVAGLIKAFPKAVNVALFRPYIWEALKPTMFIAAIEAIVTLYLTLLLLFRFKLNIIKFVFQIIANPDILFCFVFSIIFAFAVGFTSFNWGALARYKLPMIPYYFIFLMLMFDSITQKNSKNLNLAPN